MTVTMSKKHFNGIFTLMSLTFLFCGNAPVFSQEILATFGIGGQFLTHPYERRYNERRYNEYYDEYYDAYYYRLEEAKVSEMTVGVNFLFIGKSGFTTSAGIDFIFMNKDDEYEYYYYGGVNRSGGTGIDPVIGIGYVYYNTFYAGGILNVIPISLFHYNYLFPVIIAPTLVGGYNFGGFLLGGQLSYMRGVVSSDISGFKFSLTAGIKLRSSSRNSSRDTDEDDWW